MSPFQVQELVPQVLPGVPTNTVSPERLINALSAPELAMERTGGWLDDQMRSKLRGSDSLKTELRCLRSFVEWMGLHLSRWGLDSLRDKMPVSEIFLFE